MPAVRVPHTSHDGPCMGAEGPCGQGGQAQQACHMKRNVSPPQQTGTCIQRVPIATGSVLSAYRSLSFLSLFSLVLEASYGAMHPWAASRIHLAMLQYGNLSPRHPWFIAPEHGMHHGTPCVPGLVQAGMRQQVHNLKNTFHQQPPPT